MTRIKNFSLLGGPLHRLGCHLHLVCGSTNTVAMGFVIGTVLWLVLVVLGLFEGLGQQLFSLSVIGGHLRLLVVIPLFFICETWVTPRMSMFVRGIAHSKLVPDGEQSALEAEIARIHRWRDAWWPELGCAVAALLLTLFASMLAMPGTTVAIDPGRIASAMLMGQWYWGVCLTVFRFLMFRWMWRLGLWCYFLWRLSRLELKLMPIHPDGVGGLGSLEMVHINFTPLVLAISVVQSASFAEAIAAGKMTFEAIYPALAIILAVDALLFLMPMFIFSYRLWACRVQGLSDYMSLASRYVGDFDQKWLHAATDKNKELLGTPDLQSLADLSNSVNIVRNMSLAPLGPRLLTMLVIAALLPMLPLLLFRYPVTDLAQLFFTGLLGL